MNPTDNPLDRERDEAAEDDRHDGWAGVPDALVTDDSSIDDETPGSQGEIESGSEGDFGGGNEPR